MTLAFDFTAPGGIEAASANTTIGQIVPGSFTAAATSGVLTVEFTAPSSVGTGSITVSVTDAAGQQGSITAEVTIVEEGPQDFPRNGLVAFYPFNGNDNDESTNSNNGTVNGATLTTDRNGTANQAYAFDGTDDFIDCGNDASLQITGDISICVWVKPEEENEREQALVNKWANAEGYELLIDDAGRFAWETDNNTAQVVTSIDVVDEWVFIAATYDGANLRIYKDGVLASTDALVDVTGNSNINLILGRASDGSSLFFEGCLDDIMIYNRALSQEEITQVFNQTITQ
ncbi:MAG: LamG domain-containing protein [Bacteroidota bacterium]